RIIRHKKTSNNEVLIAAQYNYGYIKMLFYILDLNIE
ncbi:MAG: hypothetical protein ACI83B_003555, partial [Sediminicola sp.]